jgi:hypothetical protein
MATRRRLGLAICCLYVLAAAGCHSSGSRRAAAPAEPALSSSVGGGDDRTIIEEPPARSVSYVDRHPLFSKPREYYENSTSNSSIVKAATATFVGVPVGIFGEVRQIVVGAPPSVTH